MEKVSVEGMGYTGLPTALMMATHGVKVIGVDYDKRKIDVLNSGHTAFKEDGLDTYNQMSHACNPYGDGHACERIVNILEGKEYSPWIEE